MTTTAAEPCVHCGMRPRQPSKRYCWRCRYNPPAKRDRPDTRTCIYHQCLEPVVEVGDLYCDFHDRRDLPPEAVEQRIENAPPAVYPYECTCVACRRAAATRWTSAQAARWMQAGLLRCGVCRGAILISRADLGHIGSPARGRVA